MEKRLFEHLDDRATILTPTVRLSRYLQYRYSLVQIETGQKTWETPDCLPWSVWLAREWLEISKKSGNQHSLLNTDQQFCLWQNIIRSSAYGQSLLHIGPTARQAMTAYDICRSYDIPVFPDDLYLNEDARAFRSWTTEYQAALVQSSSLDESELAKLLLKDYASLPGNDRTLVFYGFDSLTPQQQSFIHGLRQAGKTVEILEPVKRQQAVQYYIARDNRDEIAQLASWVQQVLAKEPAASIGIIDPQLGQHRQKLVYELDALLIPGSLLSTSPPENKPYNISLGLPLADYPLINSALTLLQLGQQQIPFNVISQALLSPFIRGASTELQQRAGFDAELRESGEMHLTLKTLFARARSERKAHKQCPQFIEMLKTFDLQYLSSPKKLKAGAWAQFFSFLLKDTMHWPGERKLNSEEYQTLEAWKMALITLATLDHVTGQLSYRQALAHLSRITRETRFQPQTAEAPVQIMSPVAVAGMQFDYLWLRGCHDQAWPPPRQVNPFIPLPLQRQTGVPEANAESHLQNTHELTERMLGSAREAVISYPLQENDRELRPAALIKPFLVNATPLTGSRLPDYKLQLFTSQKLEEFIDDKAPAIAVGDTVSGGSGIFKDQSLCPFRAFARHRLSARGLQPVSTGLNAAERGELLHDALQFFWLHDRDSANLAADVSQRIEKSVTRALQSMARKKPGTLTGAFVALEKQRLQSLLKEWLDKERERPAFTVNEVEQWHLIEFAGIKIRMRIDRIDAIADGRLVVIDYKTGQVNVNEWLDERPVDPQLPLYAITTSGDVAAIVYARVKRGECRFDGLAADEAVLPGVKLPAEQDWEQQKQYWQDVLKNLADEFRQGIASVTPLEGACRYCDLHGLCRIHEKTRLEFGNSINE